jgi:predicted membrane protein
MDNTEPDKQEDAHIYKRRMGGGGRIWVPVGLVIVGIGLMLRQLGFVGVPEWLFSWQVLLITIGVFIGLSHGFRGPGWLIMIMIGTFFLMDQLIPGLDIHRFIWPAVIIVVGLVMLIRPKKPYWMDPGCQGRWKHRDIERWQRRRSRRGYPGMHYFPGNPFDSQATDPSGTAGSTTTGMGYNTRGFSSEDYIDATTVFGGIHKNILSKNFKGGDMTIFMGGAELNLSQADIQGVATLDITQIMGGTKIIVPPNWEVRSQVTSVFGNIEDKRQNISATNPDKVLIIDGSSVFGGIEIRNY